MTRHETRMTSWYWDQVGGLLKENFVAVKRAPGAGRRVLDALIILDPGRRRLGPTERPEIAGKDVVIVQTKNRRLDMPLMGQTLFSARLLEQFHPRSIRSVALCAQDDAVLRPMLDAFSMCEVVVAPSEICRASYETRPTVPDNLESIASSLMALAESLVHEPHKVWECMECSVADYLDYCAERKIPTQLELERLVELILREQKAILASNRDFLARLRAPSPVGSASQGWLDGLGRDPSTAGKHV
jgi:hypothetical protein